MKKNENIQDDSKEIVTIDYFDRINHRWIKLDVTKEVARLLHNEREKTRKANNRYYNHNLSFDEVFDSTKKENPNEKYLEDENSDPQQLLEEHEQKRIDEALREHQRAVIENALPTLTECQQEIVKLAIYENMTYSEIANLRGVSKQAILRIIRAAEKNIKIYVDRTQN